MNWNNWGAVLGIWSTSCLLAGILMAAEPNTLTAQEREDGWQLLWDGQSNAGWRSVRNENFPSQGWEMQEGVLTVLPRNAGGGGGDIITKERFASFIFKADFRLTKGANSGIKYLFDPKLNGGTTMEYQVLEETHPDARAGRPGTRTVAALYDVLPAPQAKARPLDEWNEAMIVCRGMHVEHWLNGVKVLEYERDSEAFRREVNGSKFANHKEWGLQKEGHILLQDHNDRVSYRNLKLKVLK